MAETLAPSASTVCFGAHLPWYGLSRTVPGKIAPQQEIILSIIDVIYHLLERRRSFNVFPGSRPYFSIMRLKISRSPGAIWIN